MSRILSVIVLLPAIASAQTAAWRMSGFSDGLAAYVVLSGAPSANENWSCYWGKCRYQNSKGEWGIPPQLLARDLAGSAAAANADRFAASPSGQQMREWNVAMAADAAGEANRLLQEGDVEGAIEAYGRAVHLAPDNVSYHVGFAKVLQDEGMLTGAIKQYDEAVRLQPRVADHYYFRGVCYWKKAGNKLEQFLSNEGPAADYNRALADFDKALESDPNYTNAIAGRAEVFYVTREFQKAILEYTAFLKVAPESALAYERRATSHLALEHYQDAIADYEKAIELDPKLLDAYNALVWVLATAPVDDVRNGAMAVGYGKKALALADKSQSYLYMDSLAAAYAEVGRFGDAVSLQSRAISLLPKDYNEKERDEFNRRLQLYKQHKPCHERPEV